jgi:hypothetical protein
MHRPLPRGIALVDSIFWPAEGGRAAEFWAIRLPVDSSDRRRSTWHLEEQNAVEVRFAAWWSTGIEVRLSGKGDVLRGRAEIYVDDAPSRPTWAPVTARRATCPSRIPIPTLR